MAERIVVSPREIKFGGEGKAENINRGFAIATLRNPRPEYNFSRGERILANCFDDNQKVPVVVVANEIKQLKDFSVPQLALDGFFSVPHVVNGMKMYPGYEKKNKKSIVQAITFVKEDAFNKLHKDLQKDILAHYDVFDGLVKMPELRLLFFPTMCFWLTENGANIEDWVDFLEVNHLISGEEKKKMESYTRMGSNMFKLLKGRSRMLQEVSTKPEDGLFRPLILGAFD